jgi:hypothetical protein
MRRFTLGEVKEMTNTPNEWLDSAVVVTVLLQLGSRERCQSLFLGWGMQDIARGKVLGLWVCSAANVVGGSGEIVACVPELNIGVKQ